MRRHKFEQIRYPEEIVEKGLRASIAFKKGDVTIDTYSGDTEPRYELTIDELDALAKVILEKSKFNSASFAARLNQDALIYLKKDNKSAIW